MTQNGMEVEQRFPRLLHSRSLLHSRAVYSRAVRTQNYAESVTHMANDRCYHRATTTAFEL